jgi:hypothetical protein
MKGKGIMEPGQLFVYAVVSLLIFGLPSYFTGRPKGRVVQGFFLG